MSYGRFLLKRGLQGIVVVWGVVTIVFMLRFITPGNAVDAVAPLDASPELRERIAEELGLDQPLYVQYLDYLWELLNGDMGYSYISGIEASSMVFSKLPATVELAVASSIIAIGLSIPLGVISATRRHEPADYAATTFSLVGISTPNFWLGIMLILLLSVQFGIFPTSGRAFGFVQAFRITANQGLGAGADAFYQWLRFITLPAVTLGTYFTALITRLTRSGMLEELGQSYVRATRAKGLPESLVRYKHALRNTLIPVITVLGLQLGTLIGGAVITESVFSWPGLGTTLINAINARDWPILQATLVVIGTGFVIVNLVVDAIYAYLDPQVVAE
ncbi:MULTISPECIES: ABC transporter permease [Halolamina]|uniref:Peptide/nickel transport system permease protein n=1 Tax=Halolamina pelagica TaxID=699431 RepID=A0A1I5QPL3_9EURY|nr:MULTISPECIES: ABC transporter permease [Halolamina]NHX35482.1 ABC transporter permease [Halolamina sp. R1-12]SFP48183.1 peptide/nickel transport system permease protein [Halolamina pelagica]